MQTKDARAFELDRLHAEIERLRAEVTSKSDQIGKLYRVCNERDVLIVTLNEIVKIANIPPADDRYGSLAVRMEKVWLLARGHEQNI